MVVIISPFRPCLFEVRHGQVFQPMAVAALTYGYDSVVASTSRFAPPADIIGYGNLDSDSLDGNGIPMEDIDEVGDVRQRWGLDE